MHPAYQASLLSGLTDEKAADLLEDVSPDDAADLLADLPKRRATRLLSLMEREKADEIREPLHPPRELGRRHHDHRLRRGAARSHRGRGHRAAARPGARGRDRLLRLRDRQARTPAGRHQPARPAHRAGRPPRARLHELQHPISVRLEAGEEEVTETIAKYNLLALPVVDDAGVVHGIVTIDDAIDLVLPLAWKKRLPRIFR